MDIVQYEMSSDFDWASFDSKLHHMIYPGILMKSFGKTFLPNYGEIFSIKNCMETIKSKESSKLLLSPIFIIFRSSFADSLIIAEVPKFFLD